MVAGMDDVRPREDLHVHHVYLVSVARVSVSLPGFIAMQSIARLLALDVLEAQESLVSHLADGG
jgi:hypothetical protein